MKIVPGKFYLLCKLACGLFAAGNGTRAYSQMTVSGFSMDSGFLAVPLVTKDTFKTFVVDTKEASALVKPFCDELTARFAKFKWDHNPCGTVPWKTTIKSHNGKPLIYAEFGDGEETTLFLSGVHPDELTPLPMGFRLARYLNDHKELWVKQGVRIVIAPLVNPDGFLLPRVAQRTNFNGVDLNRNLFTADWYNRAKKWWVDRRERSPSHFPGHFPNSEIETLFQIKLIEEFNPDKILSMHAPLGFLDYDGPGSASPRRLSASEKTAKRIVHAISASTRNYRIVDYSFYPGSLGNYAGNERNIPTLTLEFETTDPTRVDQYWNQFLPGFKEMIRYPFKNSAANTFRGPSLFFDGYQRTGEDGKPI